MNYTARERQVAWLSRQKALREIYDLIVGMLAGIPEQSPSTSHTAGKRDQLADLGRIISARLLQTEQQLKFQTRRKGESDERPPDL